MDIGSHNYYNKHVYGFKQSIAGTPPDPNQFNMQWHSRIGSITISVSSNSPESPLSSIDPQAAACEESFCRI